MEIYFDGDYIVSDVYQSFFKQEGYKSIVNTVLDRDYDCGEYDIDESFYMNGSTNADMATKNMR